MRLVRLGLTLGAATPKRFGLRPDLVHFGLGGQRHRLHALARDFEHGGDHAGVGAVASHQRTEQRIEDVGHFAQEFLGHFGRLGGGKLQHHGQVIGQLVGVELQARLFVGLHQIDERRATVARVAMHMLKQVQRGLAAPVKVVHIAGFDFQGVERRQVLAHGFDFRHALTGQGAFGAQGIDELRHHAAQLCIGVAQQVAQCAQRQSQRGRVLLEHGGSFQCSTALDNVRDLQNRLSGIARTASKGRPAAKAVVPLEGEGAKRLRGCFIPWP